MDVLEKGHADLTQEAAPALVYAMDGHASLIALAGVHSGCYELIGNDLVRYRARPQRQESCCLRARRRRPCVSFQHAGLRGAGPSERRSVGDGRQTRRLYAPLRRRQGGCAHGLCPGASGAAGKKGWACHCEHRPRRSMVLLLLLHARCEPELRGELPGCHKARSACNPESGGHLLARSRARRAIHGAKGLRTALSAWTRSSEGTAVQPLAYRESRRHATFPRLASARGRDDQDESRHAHFPKNRLALLERVEERAQSVGRRG